MWLTAAGLVAVMTAASQAIRLCTRDGPLHHHKMPAPENPAHITERPACMQSLCPCLPAAACWMAMRWEIARLFCAFNHLWSCCCCCWRVGDVSLGPASTMQLVAGTQHYAASSLLLSPPNMPLTFFVSDLYFILHLLCFPLWSYSLHSPSLHCFKPTIRLQ